MDQLKESPTGCDITNQKESDGAVPEHVEFETTGEVSRALYAAATEGGEVTPENLLEHLAERLGGNVAGDSPEKHAKAIKNHNRLAVLLVMLLGPGGVMAAHYALKGQANANSHEVKHLKTLEPRVEKTEEDIQFIRVRIGEIDTSVRGIETIQSEIAVGIEELKQENVTRLKQELEEAKREIRRQERLNR